MLHKRSLNSLARRWRFLASFSSFSLALSSRSSNTSCKQVRQHQNPWQQMHAHRFRQRNVLTMNYFQNTSSRLCNVLQLIGRRTIRHKNKTLPSIYRKDSNWQKHAKRTNCVQNLVMKKHHLTDDLIWGRYSLSKREDIIYTSNPKCYEN